MSASKNSVLIQQLCKHIATIQQINVKLHEQVSQSDREKELVYRALGKRSWQELLATVQDEKNGEMVNLQDTSSTCRSGATPGGGFQRLERTGLGFCKTPVRDNKMGYQSAFQSPIQSESRLVNRSIRGDTDRQGLQTNPQQAKIFDNKENFTLREPLKQTNEQVDNFLLTLNNIAVQSTSKSSLDLKNTEQENLLLSIENTKLRQRVAKLEAIVASRQYY